MVRICTFGRINLPYGYKNGDRILAQFAEILKQLLGQKGQVFRKEEPSFSFAHRG